MTESLLLLDLEGTIIESFDDPWLIHIAAIRRLLERLKPDRIGIFSYAVQSEADKECFAGLIRPQIERALAREVDPDLVPSVAQLRTGIEADRRMPRGSLTLDDFFTFFGRKADGLLQYVRCHRPVQGKRVTLLDDDVESMSVSQWDTGTWIETMPVADIASARAPRTRPLW